MATLFVKQTVENPGETRVLTTNEQVQDEQLVLKRM
jgi:hypothetical protein